MLQSEKADDLVFLGCGLWDFEATEGVHPGLMSAWTTQTAAETIDLPGQMTGGTWNVYHFMPGTADVKIGFIPDGSPWIERIGFSGAMITMTSAPEDEEEEAGEEQAGEEQAGEQDAGTSTDQPSGAPSGEIGAPGPRLVDAACERLHGPADARDRPSAPRTSRPADASSRHRTAPPPRSRPG